MNELKFSEMNHPWDNTGWWGRQGGGWTELFTNKLAGVIDWLLHSVIELIKYNQMLFLEKSESYLITAGLVL